MAFSRLNSRSAVSPCVITATYLATARFGAPLVLNTSCVPSVNRDCRHGEGSHDGLARDHDADLVTKGLKRKVQKITDHLEIYERSFGIAPVDCISLSSASYNVTKPVRNNSMARLSHIAFCHHLATQAFHQVFACRTRGRPNVAYTIPCPILLTSLLMSTSENRQTC